MTTTDIHLPTINTVAFITLADIDPDLVELLKDWRESKEHFYEADYIVGAIRDELESTDHAPDVETLQNALDVIGTIFYSGIKVAFN